MEAVSPLLPVAGRDGWRPGEPLAFTVAAWRAVAMDGTARRAAGVSPLLH
jgi:hypothetical protein